MTTMLELAEALGAAWPLLVALACAVAIDRHRESRRRVALNRAMHELRRPLQFLALAWSKPQAHEGGVRVAGTREQLAAALAALADLDAEINGCRIRRLRSVVSVDGLVTAAVERWRAPAKALGRDLEAYPRTGSARVIGNPEALSCALDNLIANSLEHGAGRICVETSTTGGRLRILVRDEGAAGGRESLEAQSLPASRAGPASPDPDDSTGCLDRWVGDRDPRRGHGLGIVGRIASGHGGGFAFTHQGSRASSVLELPLASESACALSHRAGFDVA
jgi:hypothetical protein